MPEFIVTESHRRHRLPTVAIAAALALLLLPAAGRAATIVVNATADTVADDGACTLREAAAAVNTDLPSGALPGECAAGGSATDEVIFTLPAGSVIAATSQPFAFSQSVMIWGPGPDELAIATGAIDRVMVFEGSLAPHSFTLIGVTLRNGLAVGPYDFRGDDQGGGLLVLNAQELVLSGVRFEDNFAELYGAGASIDMRPGGVGLVEDCVFEGNAVWSMIGGGGGGMFIENAGALEIRRSLFAGNSVQSSGQALPGDDPDGGALVVRNFATGTLLVDHTTFSGNSSQGAGGAIHFGATASTTGPNVVTELVSLTITGNLADSDGDYQFSSGGGLHTDYSDALVTITNSIVAGNSEGGAAAPPAPDVHAAAGTLASGGANWIGVRAGATAVFPAGQPNASGDWVGTVAAPLDPLLEPLAENGGLTRSHLPAVEPVMSPVVDAGECPGAPADQRGFTNPATSLRIWDEPTAPDAGDGCDIGAVEALLPPPNLIFADGFESGDASRWSVGGVE